MIDYHQYTYLVDRFIHHAKLYRYPRKELQDVGLTALWKAAVSWEPGRGGLFVAHAWFRINTEITAFVRCDEGKNRGGNFLSTVQEGEVDLSWLPSEKDVVASTDATRAIDRVLAGLPTQEKEALLAVYGLGMTMGEWGAVNGKSRQWAFNKLVAACHRARRILDKQPAVMLQ